MAAQRPAPIAESILPYLDAYRKVLHVPASMATIDRLPARGTTLQAAAGSGIGLDIAGCSSTELGYVYSHAQAAGGDLMALYFVKTFTTTERMTPVLRRGGTRRYSWPAVLHRIRFDFDSNFPLAAAYNDGTTAGTATAPRPFVKRWLTVDRPNWNSAAEIEVFLSDQPSPASTFEDQQPDPDEIVWDLPGHAGRIVCLHQQQRVPARPQQYSTFATARGMSNATPDGDQIFPATRMRDWQPFVFEHDEEFVQGLYVRTRVTIYPPPKPKITLETY